MEGRIYQDGRELRTGYTTGSCAAAAAKAAARLLLTGEVPREVALLTPAGISLRLAVLSPLLEEGRAVCAVRKDAGDDPDVTDGILIRAAVSLYPEGVRIDGGAGVGRVTKPGLACAVGEAAINPVPRRMIAEALRQTAARCGYEGGFSVEISAEGGETLAAQTFNPRLGIVGGISILGTSGIVEPMSERALIDTIRMEIDAKTASGERDLLLCPGNYGRDFALSAYGIDIDAGVKCSNYIGEALDYAVYKQVENILLVGHAGKLCKLAAGVMNTHSRVADCRREIFAAHAALAGADREQVRAVMESVTTDEMDGLLHRWGIADGVWAGVLERAMEALCRRTAGKCRVELILFTGMTVRESAGARALAARFRGAAGGQ